MKNYFILRPTYLLISCICCRSSIDKRESVQNFHLTSPMTLAALAWKWFKFFKFNVVSCKSLHSILSLSKATTIYTDTDPNSLHILGQFVKAGPNIFLMTERKAVNLIKSQVVFDLSWAQSWYQWGVSYQLNINHRSPAEYFNSIPSNSYQVTF